MITKFMKKKDLLQHQKIYLKPFEDIFASNDIFAVKELVIGSVNYFINNHYQNIKVGWKVLLSILADTFDED